MPSSEQLHDYSLRIEELLRTLSILENQPIPVIVRNVVTIRIADRAFEQIDSVGRAL